MTTYRKLRTRWNIEACRKKQTIDQIAGRASKVFNRLKEVEKKMIGIKL